MPVLKQYTREITPIKIEVRPGNTDPVNHKNIQQVRKDLSKSKQRIDNLCAVVKECWEEKRNTIVLCDCIPVMHMLQNRLRYYARQPIPILTCASRYPDVAKMLHNEGNSKIYLTTPKLFDYGVNFKNYDNMAIIDCTMYSRVCSNSLLHKAVFFSHGKPSLRVIKILDNSRLLLSAWEQNIYDPVTSAVVSSFYFEDVIKHDDADNTYTTPWFVNQI